MNKSRLSFLIIFMFIFSGCGSNGDSVPVYTISGTVNGLTADGLVLQNNDGDDLAVAGVTFEFATALSDGSAYAVTVLTQPTGQYCDVSNGTGTINGTNVTDVTVTCRGWGVAELIETNNTGEANSAQIAVDTSSNAITVWQQSDGSIYSIWSNRYTINSGWGTAELIETDNSGDARQSQIAVDSNGNAIAVWNQNDGTRNNIWSNRYTAGSGWGTAELIETDDSGSADAPQIAIDSSGNALAVWALYDGARNNIWSNHYTAGSGWSATPELLEYDDAGNAYVPEIAFDSKDNAIAVWHQSNGSSINIWSNRYSASGGWGTAELIETDDSGSAAYPKIALDAAGNALSVWQQSDGSFYSIWSNRYTAGSGWGTAVLIETDNTDDAGNPQIAFDTAGNAIAVWEQSDGTRNSIWSNRYTAGSGWGTAVLIETDNSGDAGNSQIVLDTAGNAIAVWDQSDGIRENIWSNRFE